MRLDHLLSKENVRIEEILVKFITEEDPRIDESVVKERDIVQFLRIGKDSWKQGGVAQLGEHLPCKQGVMGSIPIISTSRESDPHKRRKLRITTMAHSSGG